MAVQNKAFGRFAFYVFTFTLPFYAIGVIVGPMVLDRMLRSLLELKEEFSGNNRYRRYPGERFGEGTEQILATLVVLCFFLVFILLMLHIAGNWMLGYSLKLCENEPREALRVLESSLNVGVVSGVVSACTLVMFPLAIFEALLTYFLVNKYRDGLQIEVDRLGPEQGTGITFMMNGSGQGPPQMMMPEQGDDAPWPETTDSETSFQQWNNSIPSFLIPG